MIYNFRFDRSNREEIIRRIKEMNVLCQGWGGGEVGTLDIANIDDTWEYRNKVKEYYALNTTRIPSNLSKICDFCDGDLLVVPHLPENGKASIFVVDGNFPACYAYNSSDEFHLNNQIKVKRYYGLDGNIDIHNVELASWYGKLKWMRLPILPMQQHEGSFAKICDMLDNNPSEKFEPSELDKYLKEVMKKVLSLMEESINNIDSSNSNISFEGVCKYIVTSHGYSIATQNTFDRKGGDADFVCTRNRSSISPFDSGEDTLLVQVKKHLGSTDDTAVTQLIKMLPYYPDAQACVMSLANNYTDEAVKLAESNGIVLLTGKDILPMLLQNLSEKFIDPSAS